jgi:hypothetical protein
MHIIQQSLLETAVFSRFHEIYGESGFPPPESISVMRRENTGAGRYVDLKSDACIQSNDGYLDLDGCFIEMKGVPNGVMAVVLVKDCHLVTLELTVYGGDSWNGNECEWKIV